jgi:hypothetical protein
MDDPATQPSFRDVTKDLMSLRGNRGISVGKLEGAIHLLRLPSVGDGVDDPANKDHLALNAFNLIRCVLEDDSTLPEKTRKLVAIELNLADVAPTLAQRQTEILDLYPELQFGDYRVTAKLAYEKVAAYLIELNRSPCKAGVVSEQKSLAAKALSDESAAELLVAAARLLRFSRSHEAAEKYAIDILRSIPRARQALDRIAARVLGEPTPLRRVSYLMLRTLDNAGPISRGLLQSFTPRSGSTNPDFRLLRRMLHALDEDSWASFRALQFLARRSDRLTAAIELLALGIQTTEIEDGWEVVLQPPDEAGPAETIPAPTPSIY